MHPTVSPCTQAIWSSSIGTGGRHASERVDFFIGMPSLIAVKPKNGFETFQHQASRPAHARSRAMPLRAVKPQQVLTQLPDGSVRVSYV